MNRIVLIGNGFDLAHGLPTRYSDFIKWYWNNWNERLKHGKTCLEEDEFYSFRLKSEVGIAAWYLAWEWGNIPLLFNYIANGRDINCVQIAHKFDFCTINNKSQLFSDICISSGNKNWVDIETEYYHHVIKSIKLGTIKNINDHFDVVKRKFTKYLSEIQDKHIDKNQLNNQLKSFLISSIKGKDVAVSAYDKWQDFVDQRRNKEPNYWDKTLYDLGIDDKTRSEVKRQIDRYSHMFPVYNNPLPDYFTFPDRTLILNFNYTNLADLYIPQNDRFVVNHIHGELSDPDSIIFGYGDEIDKHYDELLDINENEYLRHIKSYNYLSSSNYRQLLSFIESEPYQILIMGHSCGVSDRTMLKTLFEHHNCISIKPYYHKTPSSDDYMDIVQNISRSFSDKKLMRDRVVNKTYCEPLPQSSINK